MNGSDSITDCAEVRLNRLGSMSRSRSPWQIHQRPIEVMIGASERPWGVSA